VSGAEYLKYGGDTTCLELRTAAGETVILDAGTGLRALGNQILRDGRETVHFLFTHAHWDHLIGFPFFKPLYRKNVTIHVHGCWHAQISVRNMLRDTMLAPHFPVRIDDVAARLVFDEQPQPDLRGAGLLCQSIPLSHPNGGCGFRLAEASRSLAFFPDNEFTCPHPGGKSFDDYVSFLRNVDVLVHDGEYLPEEYARFARGFGHSVYGDTVRLAVQAGAGRLLLWHLNQDRPDHAVDAMAESAQQMARDARSNLPCIVAHTGLSMEV
jgi:ribonuclease BN (tRNA processing enzyme)